MNILFGILIGFVAGLFFSRDRADPVGDAAQYAARFLQRAFDWISGILKGRPDSRKIDHDYPENR
jgi:hypothetical protein